MLGAEAADEHEDGRGDFGVAGEVGVEGVHGFEFADPTGGESAHAWPCLGGAHCRDGFVVQVGEVGEADLEGEFGVVRGDGLAVALQMLSGDGAGDGKRGLVDDEPGDWLAECVTEGADGAVGVSDEGG